MNAPSIRTVARALPANFATQDELIGALRALWSKEHFNMERLEDLHRSVQVGGRHLAVPLADYDGLTTFQARNDAWIRAAVEVGAAACTKALAQAGLKATDIDHLFFVTVTGLATPSIDARRWTLSLACQGTRPRTSRGSPSQSSPSAEGSTSG